MDLRVVLLRQGERAEAERVWRETVRLAGAEAPVVELLRKMKADWAIPGSAETTTP